MVIQADTRETQKGNGNGFKNSLMTLECSISDQSYIVEIISRFDNAKLCIDRKKDLQELCGNVCQQHERFKAELIRAREAGIQLIILCEHGPDIKSVGDVYFWENPRKHKVIWRTINGKKVKTVISDKAVDGCQLYKSLCTIRDRYGVRFEFCTKEETGRRIVELLS